MAPDERQAQIDAVEKEATARYVRWSRFAAIIQEAVRRADALQRLEAALQTQRR